MVPPLLPLRPTCKPAKAVTLLFFQLLCVAPCQMLVLAGLRDASSEKEQGRAGPCEV